MSLSSVLVQGGDEYTSWKKYRAFYSTPEADRDYLQYWEMIGKKIKVCPVQRSASSSLRNLFQYFCFFGLTMFALDSGLKSMCCHMSLLMR
jgi:hypothetical protein